MKSPRVYQEKTAFVYKVKLTMPDGATVTFWNEKGTPATKPAAALAEILNYSFICFGVPWMEAQFAKAKKAELKRADRERRERGA